MGSGWHSPAGTGKGLSPPGSRPPSLSQEGAEQRSRRGLHSFPPCVCFSLVVFPQEVREEAKQI